MGTYDVRLISASYSSDEGGGPYIELFGKTRERKSIAILVYGFKPYFYIVDPAEYVEKGLAGDPEIDST